MSQGGGLWQTFANWLTSPKTWQLGGELTAASPIGGGTVETGLFFYQEGWAVDYGTYVSGGQAFASGYPYPGELSVDVAATSVAARPTTSVTSSVNVTGGPLTGG